MAEGHHIWQRCPDCSGTGVDAQFVGDAQGVGEVINGICLRCNGDKYLFWGWMSKDDRPLPDFLPDAEA